MYFALHFNILANGAWVIAVSTVFGCSACETHMPRSTICLITYGPKRLYFELILTTAVYRLKKTTIRIYECTLCFKKVQPYDFAITM